MTEDEIKEMQKKKNRERQKLAHDRKKAREFMIWELELKRRLKERKRDE